MGRPRKSDEEKPKTTTLTARVPEGLAALVKVVAKTRGLTESDLIRQAVEEHLQRLALDPDTLLAELKAHYAAEDAALQRDIDLAIPFLRELHAAHAREAALA